MPKRVFGRGLREARAGNGLFANASPWAFFFYRFKDIIFCGVGRDGQSLLRAEFARSIFVPLSDLTLAQGAASVTLGLFGTFVGTNP